jgi:hypothetical protein
VRLGDVRIRKRKVAALLRDADAGRFAIPKLQREFVWDGPEPQSFSIAYFAECLLAY